MSDTDDSFNFLISMCYTQLFNLLCEKADDVYGGRLPVHVRCLIDECANIGQIPKLEKLVATIRSREISACLVLQAQSQLKAIYKDNADTIIGNMDTSIFLGGKEPTTLKELAAALGKETIDTYNTGESRGGKPPTLALVNKNWTLKLYFLTYNLYYFTAAYVSLYCLGVKYPREYAGRSSLKNFIYAAISSSIFSPCR